MKKLILCLVLLIGAVIAGEACTSLVASGHATANGRPMLWKHRDTGAPHNFLKRIEPAVEGEYAYVGLFNQADTALREAWTGMNRVGFAIMNTASYNLAPDTARVKDREGEVMAMALRKCRTVSDFRTMLDTLARPMGVQANFGVIDAEGGAAYFETWDNGYNYFPIGGEGEPTALIRTNFSVTGNDSTGMGYIRYDNAHHLLDKDINSGRLTAEDCVDKASRSFYHSLQGKDVVRDTKDKWAVDQDFIPRYISTAAIVIEGALPGENPEEVMKMHTRLGYPPVADKYMVTMDSLPADVQPLLPGNRCQANATASARQKKVFSIRRGSGKRYINLQALRAIMKATDR
ncbi:MAG: hypothetical protein MRZ32_05475 [Bacteroidales bacterium]|nr:hypothetical protein [Bacteroidales bacterium]